MFYSFQDVEKKWKQYWKQNNTYKFTDELEKPKFYILDMFPYPSGSGLHVGHIKGYLASDIYARYKKMKGFCVLHPIGWDAFGLPAEQYAIKHNKDPNEFTLKNIEIFKQQLEELFFSFDFSLEINTSSPKYYQHTQWIFLQMYLNNLAKLENTLVNWCPELNTVLSNEEILEIDGKKVSERGEHPVILKTLKQWILKITDYSEALLNDLEELEWDEKIKRIQKNWIGQETKYQFTFEFENQKYSINLKHASDINYLEKIHVHAFSSIVKNLKYQKNNLNNLVCMFKNEFIKHEIPVYFIESVDFRESDLIPIINRQTEINDKQEKDFLLQYLNKKFKKIKTYKLKDWVFSRQRYWGEPFPIYYCEKEFFIDNNLPVKLPKLKKYVATQEGDTPLSENKEWTTFSLNNSKKIYIRDTNTMPNWAGSSWYFLAYILKQQNDDFWDLNSPIAKEKIKRWMPVDIYIGGQEHANLHLLYARFWYKFLQKINITSQKEPFKRLINQGMILGSDGKKMSKSKGNYLNTSQLVNEFGGDILRLNIAFMGPTELSQKWENTQFIGLKKWIQKIYKLINEIDLFIKCSDDDLELSVIESELIKKTEINIEKFHMNVVISDLMIFINKIFELKKYSIRSLESFFKILSFFAPAFSEEIWFNFLKHQQSIYLSNWPILPEISTSTCKISLQINNKHKIMLDISNNLNEQETKNFVLKHIAVKKIIENKEIIKIFVIPKKTINIICK